MSIPEIRTTTITDIGDDRYEIVRPIRIDICKMDGKFRAWTVSLSEEIDGYGFTEEEAVSDLKQVIVAHLDIENGVARGFIREKKQ